MQKLNEYLSGLSVDAGLSSVVLSLADLVKKISVAMKSADTGKAGTQNVYGEEQIALDVLSNDLFVAQMKECKEVGLIASEELSDQTKLGDGVFAVATDPLDGSSLFDVNLTVGSIFGVYKTDNFIGVKGSEQCAAVMSVYGPRTTLVLSVGHGTSEFALNEAGEFVLVTQNMKISEGKMFAPGNLRACEKREDYLKLVNFWIQNQYTLRYSGGMVPDVNQILVKGKGIFAYPGSVEDPSGKLRLLYECAPLAMLVEQAGGASSDGNNSILDKVLTDLEMQSPVFLGSKEEVLRCEEYLK